MTRVGRQVEFRTLATEPSALARKSQTTAFVNHRSMSKKRISTLSFLFFFFFYSSCLALNTVPGHENIGIRIDTQINAWTNIRRRRDSSVRCPVTLRRLTELECRDALFPFTSHAH